jgi:hypothetical protein
MSERSTLDRREFTIRSLMAMLSGVTVVITGCGPNITEPTMTDKVGLITGNHGHSVLVTSAQLAGGGAVTLSIQGTSKHLHSVELSRADVGAIRDGRKVEKHSSESGSHYHTVTFN